jgi:phosphoribosylanthranilate isomerase
LEDALASIEFGANVLGFNFYPLSPRYIAPVKASEILQELPESIIAVAVVVVDSSDDPRADPKQRGGVERLEDLSAIDRQCDQTLSNLPTRIDWVQVHGVLGKVDLQRIPGEILVATSPKDASRFRDFRIIIDTSWGTGQLADWEALKGLGREYILSGGLTPENVKEALDYLEPYGVDVCSGVEATPGKKDLARLKRFLEVVREHYRLS